MKLVVNIEKRLRSFTLAANFTLTDTTLALLGASGSGKSMTLKCIAGLERPDRGQILLNGRTLYDSEKGINLPPQARGVGYLFQNYALFPNMTVHENIIFALDGTREEKERILAENVARFSLEGIENAYPARLSGGQQQRAAFARILARGADLPAPRRAAFRTRHPPEMADRDGTARDSVRAEFSGNPRHPRS